MRSGGGKVGQAQRGDAAVSRLFRPVENTTKIAGEVDPRRGGCAVGILLLSRKLAQACQGEEGLRATRVNLGEFGNDMDVGQNQCTILG